MEEIARVYADALFGAAKDTDKVDAIHDELDLRPGGAWRIHTRPPERMDFSEYGVFREIVAPERIVATEKFDESWYAGEAVDTTVFVEKGGRTTVTMTGITLRPAPAPRRTAAASGGA